jgi:hypothetical protein
VFAALGPARIAGIVIALLGGWGLVDTRAITEREVERARGDRAYLHGSTIEMQRQIDSLKAIIAKSGRRSVRAETVFVVQLKRQGILSRIGQAIAAPFRGEQ